MWARKFWKSIKESTRVAYLRRKKGFSQLDIAILVILVLVLSVTAIYIAQYSIEQRMRYSLPPESKLSLKDQLEIVKLAAEAQHIASDTTGSLFWLKLIALFVTVGGAIGGYLLAQSRVTLLRLDFEHRKNVDAAYQSIVQELSDSSELLRAAAAVKLGMILKKFPEEWVDEADKDPRANARRDQLVDLTKKVLAASLAIEEKPKVRKAITIALPLHRPWSGESPEFKKKDFGDLREIDLSGAKASDAYWARVDFTGSDFYCAELIGASLRRSILDYAQFREAKINNAVLSETHCEKTNFKMADLRGVDFSNSTFVQVNFEGAKVGDVNLKGVKNGEGIPVSINNLESAISNLDAEVEISTDDAVSNKVTVRKWLTQSITS